MNGLGRESLVFFIFHDGFRSTEKSSQHGGRRTCPDCRFVHTLKKRNEISTRLLPMPCTGRDWIVNTIAISVDFV